MMVENRKDIVRWIVRYVQGELDASEREGLERWRAASPGNEELFQRVTSRRYFDEGLRVSELSREEKDAEWRQIYRQTVGSRGVRFRRVMRYAAVVVVMFTVGGLWYFHDEAGVNEKEVLTARGGVIKELESRAILVLSDGREFDLKKTSDLEALASHKVALSADSETLTYSAGSVDTIIEYHTLKIPRGGEYVLVLGDGSTVYLNAESELTYPAQFTGSERRVSLTGEAYFEVKKDSTRPFVVDVNPLRVQVLGTEFGVRAYEDEERILTTLKRGKVSVESGMYGVVLDPRMQADFLRADATMEVKEVDVNLFVGWKDGRLIFDNCTLERVLKDLGRWYAFDVVFEREERRAIPFSLNIKKHEAFADVLNLMEETGCVKFEIEGNTVIVK